MLSYFTEPLLFTDEKFCENSLVSDAQINRGLECGCKQEEFPGWAITYQEGRREERKGGMEWQAVCVVLGFLLSLTPIFS